MSLSCVSSFLQGDKATFIVVGSHTLSYSVPDGRTFKENLGPIISIQPSLRLEVDFKCARSKTKMPKWNVGMLLVLAKENIDTNVSK